MSTPLIDKTFEGRMRRIDRDIIELFRRLARLGGSEVSGLPDAMYALGPAANTITAGASSWLAIPGAVVSITPPRSLIVDVEVTGICQASAGYTMIGSSVNGADPYDGIPGGTAAAAPFTSSTVSTGLKSATKRVTIPAGSASTFAFWARRNVGSGTQTCNYPLIAVLPVRWAS